LLVTKNKKALKEFNFGQPYQKLMAMLSESKITALYCFVDDVLRAMHRL